MIKNIFEGTKEVLTELTSGMTEVCQDISVKIEGFEVRLMGTYEEIEAYEKSKEIVEETTK
ncbi:MAG: Unknown protein [uncultured Sulfurovum sp.]|uniref:Uncharacterized protein n=1 Tax=uncultured Sulfurovum sp. TaxID=269237 RepID=A0A6S6SVS9_9BACT|nr:MAG: Unknown protein [uncultured Sulfurovum sp.]